MPETRNTRSAKKEPKTNEKRSQSASKSSKSIQKPTVIDSVAEQKAKAKEWAEKQGIFLGKKSAQKKETKAEVFENTSLSKSSRNPTPKRKEFVTPEPDATPSAKATTRASTKKSKTEVKKDLTLSFEKIKVEPKKAPKGSMVVNFGFIIAVVVAIIAALLYAADKYKLIKFK